jgi:hypothetical protein
VPPDPMMDRIMDPGTYRPCRCTAGESCDKPAVPGDMFCAGCLRYCLPRYQLHVEAPGA